MEKRKTWGCKSVCCHNICLPVWVLDDYADKIVTPVIERTPLPPSRNIPVPSELIFTNMDFDRNKCSFLCDDYKCNIYEHRPTICRKFGKGGHPLLVCRYRK